MTGVPLIAATAGAARPSRPPPTPRPGPSRPSTSRSASPPSGRRASSPPSPATRSAGSSTSPATPTPAGASHDLYLVRPGRRRRALGVSYLNPVVEATVDEDGHLRVLLLDPPATACAAQIAVAAGDATPVIDPGRPWESPAPPIVVDNGPRAAAQLGRAPRRASKRATPSPRRSASRRSRPRAASPGHASRSPSPARSTPASCAASASRPSTSNVKAGSLDRQGQAPEAPRALPARGLGARRRRASSRVWRYKTLPRLTPLR